MLTKVLILALAVGASFARDCGKPAIAPDTSRFRSLIHSMAKGKIVGGTEAVPHSWPWQVSMLTSSGSQICGGSIYNNNWIITAAHCCKAMSDSPSRIQVGAGFHNLNGNPGSVVHKVSEVFSHEQYNAGKISNDICLLKLAEPIEYNDHASPVCLPTAEHGEVGRRCFVTGWGTTGRAVGSFEQFVQQVLASEKAPHREVRVDALRQVDVNVVDQEACKAAYGASAITDDMVCAAAPGKDSCQGDSGGPFVCEHDGEYKLIGIVSWGRGCALPAYPGVYARTSHFLDWINRHVGRK